MQIIISMAGLGNRFKERGFKTPKHLIKINNKTLIEHSIETLDISGKFFFILRNNIDNNELHRPKRKMRQIFYKNKKFMIILLK